MNNPEEQTGPEFNLQTYLKARQTCKQVLDQIFGKLQEGMTEADLQSLVKEEFKAIGVDKFWHPTKARIGSETLKTFRAPADPNIVLQKGDLCFIDIGPIINNHEADFGRTLVFNSEAPSPLIQACEQVFKKTSQYWKTKKPTGHQLYRFAEELSKQLGYQLNPKMAGHRLGDFPHHVYSKESLSSFNKNPIENLWVLEIHLLDLKNNLGAFYEDILI